MQCGKYFPSGASRSENIVSQGASDIGLECGLDHTTNRCKAIPGVEWTRKMFPSKTPICATVQKLRKMRLFNEFGYMWKNVMNRLLTDSVVGLLKVPLFLKNPTSCTHQRTSTINLVYHVFFFSSTVCFVGRTLHMCSDGCVCADHNTAR